MQFVRKSVSPVNSRTLSNLGRMHPCARSVYLRRPCQLEIFLDLGEPKSSAAWPILNRAIDDYSERLEFVFHVTPPSGSSIASTLRKVKATATNFWSGYTWYMCCTSRSFVPLGH